MLLALLIICCIFIIFHFTNKLLLLKGLWTSHNQSSNDMDVDDIWLLIGDIIFVFPFYVSYNALLMIKKDNKMLLCEKTKISIYGLFDNLFIKFNDVNSDHIPSTCSLNYDMQNSKIIIYKNNTAYAVLYKNNYYSDIMSNKNIFSDKTYNQIDNKTDNTVDEIQNDTLIGVAEDIDKNINKQINIDGI